ncbi:MAG: hypothetical protein K5978_02110, partial [Campylobacter sp.]|nr:hypothetical protein [Campylobacter sp.]
MKKLIIFFLATFTFANEIHLNFNQKVKNALDSNQSLKKSAFKLQKSFDILMGKYDFKYLNDEAQKEIKPYLQNMKQIQEKWIESVNKASLKKD